MPLLKPTSAVRAHHIVPKFTNMIAPLMYK